MWISNTEKSPHLRSLGKPSRLPEKFGCDFACWIPSTSLGRRLFGCQRKTVQDLISSLHDDRLKIERAQWNRLLDLGGIVVLVIEGKMSWSADGTLMYADNKPLHGRPFTRSQFRRLCYSIERQGVVVQHTDSTKDTADFITDLIAYHEPRTGSRLSGRPRPPSKWGHPSSREWLCHVLTSFQDIGPTTAEAILDACGGRLPLQWTVSYEELLKIPGVGKKRADSLWRALHPLTVVEPPKRQAGKQAKNS